MRSFTKKNLPYKKEMYYLIHEKDQNMNDLLAILNDGNFKRAYERLINFFVDPGMFSKSEVKDTVSYFKAVKNIKDGNDISVKNFHLNIQPADGSKTRGKFTRLNFGGAFFNDLEASHPLFTRQSINNQLRNHGVLDIKENGADDRQTIENIASLLAVNCIYRTVTISSKFIDHNTYEIFQEIDHGAGYAIKNNPMGGGEISKLWINSFFGGKESYIIWQYSLLGAQTGRWSFTESFVSSLIATTILSIYSYRNPMSGQPASDLEIRSIIQGLAKLCAISEVILSSLKGERELGIDLTKLVAGVLKNLIEPRIKIDPMNRIHEICWDKPGTVKSKNWKFDDCLVSKWVKETLGNYRNPNYPPGVDIPAHLVKIVADLNGYFNDAGGKIRDTIDDFHKVIDANHLLLFTYSVAERLEHQAGDLDLSAIQTDILFNNAVARVPTMPDYLPPMGNFMDIQKSFAVPYASTYCLRSRDTHEPAFYIYAGSFLGSRENVVAVLNNNGLTDAEFQSLRDSNTPAAEKKEILKDLKTARQTYLAEPGQLFASNLLSGPFDEDDSTQYKRSKEALIKAEGLYCAYCESPVNDANCYDIEHKLPKSMFPSEKINWDNLVVSCKLCNGSAKSDQILYPYNLTPGAAGRKEIRKGEGFISTDFRRGRSNYNNPVDEKTSKNSNYENWVAYNKNHILWPDIVNSFEFATYSLPDPAINVTEESHLIVRKNNGGTDYQTDLKLGININAGLEVRNKIVPATDYRAKAIIEICKLNNVATKEVYNDQRRIRRTKAWLHARKQLMAFQALDHLPSLKDHWKGQLELSNVMDGTSKIRALRNSAGNNIAWHPISGRVITVNVDFNIGEPQFYTIPNADSRNLRIANGAGVNVPDGAGTVDLRVDVISMEHGNTFVDGILTFHNDWVDQSIKSRAVNFRRAQKTTLASGQIQLEFKQVQCFVTDHADDVNNVKEWYEKQKALDRELDKAQEYLKKITFDNAKNMVKDGGFYSTWVRTFEEENPQIAKDLVRRLEVDAQSNPDDPFQFHGTDAIEIMSVL